MARLTEGQLQEKEAVDALRTFLRLKHRNQQRREQNQLENDMLDEMHRRLAAGESFSLDLKALLGGE